jgi:hypothetical protein
VTRPHRQEFTTIAAGPTGNHREEEEEMTTHQNARIEVAS